jgi:hypothetical protein
MAAWGMAGASAAWTGYRAADTLMDRSAHEQSLSLTDRDARAAWLSLAGSALTGGGMVLSKFAAAAAAAASATDGADAANPWARMAGITYTGANYVDTAAVGNQAYDLVSNWNQMAPTERAEVGLQLAFWGGMRTVSALNVGQGLGSYSFRQQIRFAELASEAAGLRLNAGRAESYVTPTLQLIAETNGGEMLGLDNRLKTTASLKRKIASSNKPKSFINDVLRYTISFDEQDFTRGVQNTMASLKAQGYTQTKFSNTFKPGQPYMGINITYSTPKGEIFELQFHTSASFHMKDVINHPLYEKQRVLPDGDTQIKTLRDQMTQNSSSVSIPPGASSIKRLR